MKRERLAWAVPLLAFAAFLPALRGGFVDWDDKIFVVRNDRLLLSAAGLKWMFTTTYLGLYQPLSWLSLAVDKAIWGGQAFGFHLTNLLLHAFNGGLVLLLGRRLLRDERQALAAALLFALHPLRAEAVAWVTGRKDLLATSFYLLTVLLYIEGRLKAACACFAAGLMTKASGVGLPVVLWLLDRSLRRSGPFFALSLAFGLAGAFAGQQFSRGYGWLERLGLAAYGAAFYIRKTLWPSGLGPIYEIPVPFSDLWPMAAGSSLLLLGLAAAAWRWRGLRIPLAAYLALVLPTLGLVQFGKHLAADRYSYLACLPLAFLAAKVRRVVWVLPVLFALSWAQAGHWRDSLSLWTRGVEAWPRSAVAQSNLAAALSEQGRVEEALLRARAAARIDPGHAAARENVGLALAKLGRHEEALTHLERKRLRAMVYFNWGNAQRRARNERRAAELYRLALSEDPGYEPAARNLRLRAEGTRRPGR